MEVRSTGIDGVLVCSAPMRIDERGYFVRTYDRQALERAGVEVDGFVQDSQSRSLAGTVRGLHLRTDGREAKLVRCASGAVHDVVVDLRPVSPTYGRVEAFRLDDRDHLSLYLPPGCAHGFQALTDAVVCYRMDASYDPRFDATVAHDDPQLAIAWPLPVTRISPRDAAAPSLAEVRPLLAGWFGAG